MKILILLVSVFSSIGQGDGWFPVEKIEATRAEESWEDQDQSIWPVFSKHFGGEKVLARFPADPVYRYLSSSEIEITATKGAETSQLTILDSIDPEMLTQRVKEISVDLDTLLVKVEQVEPHIFDLQYFKEGMWVAERLLLTGEHLYIFRTASSEPLSGNHQTFVSLIDIR